MDDMTRLVGVSVQTVSCMTVGSDHIHPDTRAKVSRVINKLGYPPSRAAQALRRGSLETIGMLTQQIQRIGGALATASMLEAATAANYAINPVQAKRPVPSDLRQAVYRLFYQAIDGPVAVRAGRAGREHLVLPPSIPVAASDSTFVDHYPSISADQVDGVRGATERLLRLGYRNIQYVCGPGDPQSSPIRRATWVRYLREAGLPAPEPIPGDQETVAGYAAGWLLAVDPEVTAVFCANDELALGLIRAMYEQDRRVLGGVSAVGFDGLDVGKYNPSSLTTVHQDFRRHDHEVVGPVLEQMVSGMRDNSRGIIIPTGLILRGSTAPPPAT